MIADTTELIGAKKGDLPSLREHEFLVQWRGSNELRRLQVRTDLADERRGVSSQEWDACVEQQLATYYRPIVMPPLPEPVSASPAAPGGKPSPATGARGKPPRELL